MPGLQWFDLLQCLSFTLMQEKDTSEERLQRVKRELQEMNNAIERAREQEEARVPTLRSVVRWTSAECRSPFASQDAETIIGEVRYVPYAGILCPFMRASPVSDGTTMRGTSEAVRDKRFSTIAMVVGVMGRLMSQWYMCLEFSCRFADVVPPSGSGRPHVIDLDPSAMSETQLADHLWAAVARASAAAGE